LVQRTLGEIIAPALPHCGAKRLHEITSSLLFPLRAKLMEPLKAFDINRGKYVYLFRCSCGQLIWED